MSSLTILIPTLRERYRYLQRLQAILHPQINKFPGRVSITYNDAGRQMCIGQKRNAMMAGVMSEYVVFADDDDLVTRDYLPLIMAAIDKGPDVVTFNGWMTTNGANPENFVIRLGERYEKRDGVYYRYPNHLCPMKTNIARMVRFPHVITGEDFAFATQLRDRNLLKTSEHIENKIYHYDYRSRK